MESTSGSNSPQKNDQSFLPSCWEDDTRMNALFAPFRNRSVNPRDWDTKLTFWRNLIADSCVYKNKSIFTAADLSDTFKRNGRVPGCLPNVIAEMIKTKEICTVKQFTDDFNSNGTWSSWMFSALVKKPFYWSIQKLKQSVVTAENPADTLVHVETLRQLSELFLSSVPDELRNTVLSLQELEEHNLVTKRDDQTELLFNYLVATNKICIRNIHGTVLIKVFRIDKKCVPISDIDVGIHTLQQQEKSLLHNLEKLEAEKNSAIAEAKEYLRKGHRQMAKSSLRKKHAIEKRIDKRADALDNVETLLARMKDAESDGEVLDAYKLGLSTLKTTFKEAGLSEDIVTDTMVELGEVLEIHDDIEKMLAQPCLDMYDADVEEELAAILAEDETNGSDSPKPPNKQSEEDDINKSLEERLKLLAMNLPDVPINAPRTTNEFDSIVSP